MNKQIKGVWHSQWQHGEALWRHWTQAWNVTHLTINSELNGRQHRKKKIVRGSNTIIFGNTLVTPDFRYSSDLGFCCLSTIFSPLKPFQVFCGSRCMCVSNSAASFSRPFCVSGPMRTPDPPDPWGVSWGFSGSSSSSSCSCSSRETSGTG